MERNTIKKQVEELGLKVNGVKPEGDNITEVLTNFQEEYQGGSKKLEVEDITALTAEQIAELEVGSVVECQGKLYSVEEKTEAVEPIPVKTIDGVDYYHMLDGVNNNFEINHYYDLEGNDLGTNTPALDKLPYIYKQSMGNNHFALKLNSSDFNMGRQCSITYGSSGTILSTSTGALTISQTIANNTLNAEYFTAGYFEKTTEEGIAPQGGNLYYNLVNEPTQPAKLNLVSVDSENVVEVKYEDNTYDETITTSIEPELPATLGTAGQVLTVNETATGVEWANASGGTQLYKHIIDNKLLIICNDSTLTLSIENYSYYINNKQINNYLYHNCITAKANNYTGEDNYYSVIKFSGGGGFDLKAFYINESATQSEVTISTENDWPNLNVVTSTL